MALLEPTPDLAPQGADSRASRGSASDAVFWGVVRGLEDQHFVPGQRLVESDLATRFNVGRNAVREAIQRLAAEGLVDLSRHRGASIRTLSRQEALDLLDIVERLLGLLARSAARGSGNQENATELELSVKKLGEADEQRDSVAFSAARRHFYRTLLEMGGNRDLERLFTTIHIPILYARQRVPSLQTIRLADYKVIAATVLRGDADAADRAGGSLTRLSCRIGPDAQTPGPLSGPRPLTQEEPL